MAASAAGQLMQSCAGAHQHSAGLVDEHAVPRPLVHPEHLAASRDQILVTDDREAVGDDPGVLPSKRMVSGPAQRHTTCVASSAHILLRLDDAARTTCGIGKAGG